ncbi:MAG TPA: alpha/beta hydrolase [Actinomycetaceae bacterium]|nr:alpha/beta hydrolase [Actinomycetaceae bacterium]
MSEIYLEPLPTGPLTDTGWHDDVLGAGFEARTLPLLDDDQGPVVATLVRYVPGNDPLAHAGTPTATRFVGLWIHGWNDYFHQRELARVIARLGGAFYALDLRKYGRSLRAGQLHGYITNLSTYDEDFHAALAVIRDEVGIGTDLVLMGHSTGGLVAALWAHRHPGALRALVLDAPWLELQGSVITRTLGTQLIDTLSRVNPTGIVPLADTGFYARTLAGWIPDDDGERPPGTAGDPFYDGWQLDPNWKSRTSALVRPGWLSAIRAGQSQVAQGLEITCPILVLTSARTNYSPRWLPELREVDSVLDVEQIAQRSLGLGPLVTLARFDGAVHDVFLSRQAVRTRVYCELERWLRAYAIR